MTLPGKLHRYLKPAFAIFGFVIFVFAGIVLWEEFSYTKQDQSPEQSGGTKVALVYSPRYNITAFGMESLHPNYPFAPPAPPPTVQTTVRDR